MQGGVRDSDILQTAELNWRVYNIPIVFQEMQTWHVSCNNYHFGLLWRLSKDLEKTYIYNVLGGV